MKLFLFSMIKKLLWYWASKLIGPEAISELLVTLADAHAKRTDTKTDDKLVTWLKKHLDTDGATE